MEISSHKSSLFYVSSSNLNHFAPLRKNQPSLLIYQYIQLSILTKLFYKSVYFLRFVGSNPLQAVKVSDEEIYQNHLQSSTGGLFHYDFHLHLLSWSSLSTLLIQLVYLSGASYSNYLIISGHTKISNFMAVTGGDG